MTFLKNMIADLKNDKIQAGAVLICLALFVWVVFFKTDGASVLPADASVIELYHSHTCPHCKDAIAYIDTELKAEFPQIEVRKMELTEISPDAQKAFMKFAEQNDITGVPVLKRGERFIVGFNQNNKAQYRKMFEGTLTENVRLTACAYGDEGGCDAEPQEISAADIAAALGIQPPKPSRIVNLPLFGEIDVFQKSIPYLAVVLGLVDGFNPCAMWVLVFMISVIVGLKDKKKTFVIVGSFVGASAVFYFALMAGWINLFKIIGYMRLLTVGIGSIALYTGFASLRSFFGGHVTCKVTTAEDRNKLKNRITELAERPLSWATLTGVFALAIVVNGIEFVCSAALPAIFTSVLAFSHLSTLMHYWYITVYVFFFMLDDLIVFSLAAFAVNKYAGEKYMVWCQLIGGAILLVLGFLMLFHPDWLA